MNLNDSMIQLAEGRETGGSKRRDCEKEMTSLGKLVYGIRYAIISWEKLQEHLWVIR